MIIKSKLILIMLMLSYVVFINNALADSLNTNQALMTIKNFIIEHEQLLHEYCDKNPNSPSVTGMNRLAHGIWKWLAMLKHRELSIDNDDDWHIISQLWDNLAEALPPKNQRKLTDAKVLAAIAHLYGQSHGKSCIRDLGRMALTFNIDLWLMHSDIFMAPYLDGSLPSELLLSSVPSEVAKKYPEYFQHIFHSHHKAIHQMFDRDSHKKIKLLEFDAYFGDEQARRELMTWFEQCPGENNDFDTLLASMFVIGTKEAYIAALSRFHEEIGAPFFDASGAKRPSPRHFILRSLMRVYPQDWFFQKYRDYLSQGDFPRCWALDEQIGGELGVRRLFKDLQKWTKEKFDFNLDLKGVTYHIHSAYVLEGL